VEDFIQSLLEKEIIPGISLLVARNDQILLKKEYGWKSLLPQKEPLQDNTLYDLASLTKPLITALLTVYLLEKEKGSIDPNTKIKKVFPLLPNHFNDITLLHLLTHTSGLPAWYPFYLFGEDYFNRVKLLWLESKPGRRVNYSCVGYILLFFFIEKVSGLPFTELAQQVIIEPLNLKNTYLVLPHHLKETAAPTEEGNRFERRLAERWGKENRERLDVDFYQRLKKFKWRTSMIQGETNDINSYFWGGTAGNAGLFSTTEDVFHLCREFFPNTASILKTESLKLFWKNYTLFKKSHRTLGFKRNSSLITSGGRALSWKAIGHNGFTGTSLWLDPREETVYILLTNRIHPSFKPFNFNKTRRILHRKLKSFLK